MIGNEMNISEVETYIYGLMNGVVSNNTYVGTLPETIESGCKDMLLIDCGDGITDMNGYGYGTVLLFTYAKPMSKGRKNVAKLKTMDEAINTILANQDSSGHYYLNRRNTYTDYDSNRNWHCNVITIGITVR